MKKMDLLLSAKYFGLIALATLVAGLIFLIIKWPKDIHHTFSQHAATNNRSSLYYSLLFAIVLPVLAVFLFSWFVPFFNVPSIFTVLVGLSMVFQYACTLVPEMGKNVKSHQTLAGISGLLLLPGLALCTLASGVSAMDKFICAICVVFMVAIAIAVTYKRTRYALILQSAYFTAFFVPILVISYI